MRLAIIFIFAIMGSFSLILLIIGSLATGATRHRVYSGFRSRLGGRIATGLVNMEKKKNYCFLILIRFSFLFFDSLHLLSI